MKLHDLEPSGNCYKVRLFCALIQQPLTLISVDFMAGEHKSAPYLAMNSVGLNASWPFQLSLVAHRRTRKARKRASNGTGQTKWRPDNEIRLLRSRLALKLAPWRTAKVKTKCEHIRSRTGASLSPGDMPPQPRSIRRRPLAHRAMQSVRGAGNEGVRGGSWPRRTSPHRTYADLRKQRAGCEM